ncbi:MAG: MFS transporter [candidate division KSB1 bacterium]|nr:MFS transporter [candidate division KSB1 bacterium]
MEKRTPFPKVVWVANLIEVLERFAYYGIYVGFGIYMTTVLKFEASRLGTVQSIFLFFSYVIPVISGSFADRFGFKKILIVSYLAYLPSILLLIILKSFSGVLLTMLSIALAAGIFKPLISGTVRSVTDKTNKTLGFGIFYAMVNIGASFGPIIAGKLRVLSWNYAFLAAATGVILMLLITIFFYKEPPRQIEGATLKTKLNELVIALSNLKFATFLAIIGLFFWLPLWAFFNLCPLYVDTTIDTAQLYLTVKSIFGSSVANFISRVDEHGVRRILGETISHTGYIIMIFQVIVSRIAERFKALPTFSTGLLIAALGMLMIGIARVVNPNFIFAGIFLFAIGEMTASPRIQEYITWIAPKEQAGLYMGSNFLPIAVGGALSGYFYTSLLYSQFSTMNHPEYVWLILAGNFLLGVLVLFVFTKRLGEFKELEQ